MQKIVLDIKNLEASIENKKIIKNVDLQIFKSKTHVIMGPNGAGKSTLAKLIAGHPDYQIDEGQILFNEDNITEKSPEERAHLGIFTSFQHPPQISGISYRNFFHVSYNSLEKSQNKQLTNEKEFNKLLDKKMKQMQIPENFKERKINGNLSGGEKKKMEILQMLLLQPKLIILDEIDSGLDIDAVKMVSKTINQIKNDEHAFLIITHYQRILNYIKPDYIHVMVEGTIVHSGDSTLVHELEQKGYDWLLDKKMQVK